MVKITTDRFVLRELSEADASDTYLSWFDDQVTKQFIQYSAQKHQDLKNYIAEKLAADDCLFLGIFTHEGDHIGNIKYEPINLDAKSAMMGILIGETAWRGKGVAKEVIGASGKYLKQIKQIRYIDLGVELDNFPAIAAYEKLGFKKTHEALAVNGMYMRWTMD